MQFLGQAKPPVGIVFDSDMGTSIDTALALALLYGFDGKNEARVVSISVTRSNLSSAAYCEAVGRFYAGAVNGSFAGAGFGRNLPVGMAIDGRIKDDTGSVSVPLAKMNAEGKPVYVHGIHKHNDTAEVPALIRNAFTSQYDQNSIALLAGPATNFAAVLDLPGVKDLLVRKCRYLAMTGGVNIKADIKAARKLFAEWPTPIVVSGADIGEAVHYPASSIEKDFAWSPSHPVVDAYRAFKPMPYDAPTLDLAAAMYGGRPKAGYFKASNPGTFSVTEQGKLEFKLGSQGKHIRLTLNQDQKADLLKAYIELVSAKPVPKLPRFRPPQAEKKEPEKPAVEK